MKGMSCAREARGSAGDGWQSHPGLKLGIRPQYVGISPRMNTLSTCSGQTAFQRYRLLALATLPGFGGRKVHGAFGLAEGNRPLGARRRPRSVGKKRGDGGRRQEAMQRENVKGHDDHSCCSWKDAPLGKMYLNRLVRVSNASWQPEISMEHPTTGLTASTLSSPA